MIWSWWGLPATVRSSHRPPRLRLVAVACGDQRHQRKGRVAQPAVAIVPVAFATELLRQRGGGCSDDPAGLSVGQRLRASTKSVVPLPSTGRYESNGPTNRARTIPFPRRAALPVHRRGRRQMRWAVRQHERDTLPFGNVKLRDSREIPALHRDRRAQHHLVRPGNGAQAGSIIELRHPWHSDAVVEPQRQVQLHRHLAAESFH